MRSDGVRPFTVLPLLLLATVLPAGVRDAAAGKSPPARPNVLLILADDLGAECLASYGGTSYKTPHLDALAKGGTRFEHCYATPLCSPSRVELMTGRYPFRTGWTRLINREEDEFLDPKVPNFAHMLRDGGYRTAMAGKWQLARFEDHPDHLKQCGFQEYSAWSWVMAGRRTSRYWGPSIWQEGKLRTDVAERYGPDVFREFLTEFMGRKDGRPFLAYYPMALVHEPFHQTPDARAAKVRGAGRAGRQEQFAGMMAYMDWEVGELMAALDRHGLRERTLVLFTGDNGTPKQITSRVGETEVAGGKGRLTEAGTRVPLIASWKGTVPAGRVSPDLVDFSDFLPTLAEITGAKPPRGVTLDGRSFAPQLRGKPGRPREWVFSQLRDGRFVRDREWKLHGDGRLYHVKADPFETRDLAGSPDGGAAKAKKRLQPLLDRLK
jgi:arylsulfatase A